MELPNKKFQIIYCDPAWQYNDKRSGSGHKNPNGAGGCSKHYDTMPLSEICDLDIQSISDDNCMLFIWCTSALLDYGFEVIKSWGFKFKNVGFVWVKLTKDLSKTYSGMGSYTNQNAEFCLLALKGKYWRVARNVKQIVLEPRGKHSKKPDCVRDRIVELCGDLPRIELFARERADGWESWGNELNG